MTRWIPEGGWSRASLPVLFLVSISTLACGGDGDPITIDPNPPDTRFVDLTLITVPSTNGTSMDALARDFDSDGDLDIIVAIEFFGNQYLNNLGDGRFSRENIRLPLNLLDSEDIAAWDFDEDGDLDVVIVSEDTQENEYYVNDGTGFFVDFGAGMPTAGTSNAVVAADFDADGHGDLLIGNNGQNEMLMGNGLGGFVVETSTRLPSSSGITQDVDVGDVDGDGDLDVIEANEGANRLLINDGSGVFTDESGSRLPVSASETREAAFGDVDGDGDLDVAFGNVRFLGSSALNELYLNDGSGTFSDASNQLPPLDEQSIDVDLVDLDADGDLDLLVANFNEPNRALVNDGVGNFADSTQSYLPGSGVGPGFDFEPGDFTGDGLLDLYLANRGTSDRLYATRAN